MLSFSCYEDELDNNPELHLDEALEGDTNSGKDGLTGSGDSKGKGGIYHEALTAS